MKKTRPSDPVGGTSRQSRTALAVLLTLTAAIAAAPALGGRQQRAAGANSIQALALPDAPAKPILQRVCSGCHDPSLVMFKREDEEGWAVIVQDMAARGARGTEEELRAITEYLSAHFNRSEGFRPLVVPGTREAAEAKTGEQLFAAGEQIYGALCTGCHQANGRGREKIAPSLVNSELVLGPAGIPVRIMLHGKRGPTNVMPALGQLLADEQIAAALTYIRRAWGHTAPAIDAAAVTEIRAQTSGRARPWSAEELQKAAGAAR